MEVSIQSLSRSAHLFANVLSELKYRDGWLSFEPEFAEFVVGKNIEWWELYELGPEKTGVNKSVTYGACSLKSVVQLPIEKV